MAETFTVEIIAGTPIKYKCTGSIVGVLYFDTDAATAIQTAMDNADSEDTINIQTGTYPVNSQLQGVHNGGVACDISGVTINGVGAPVLNFSNQGYGSTLFTCYHDPYAAATLETDADLEHGGRSLTTTAPHGASEDDLMFITTTTIWRNNSGNNRQGEIRRVMSIDGNTLYFERGFEDDYPQGVTTVYRLNVVNDITIDGIKFYNSIYEYTGHPGVGAGKNFVGLYFKYGDNIEITNCTFEGIENRAIRWDNVVDSTINNCTFKYATKVGAGYGVNLVYACQNIIVNDNDAYLCRHWVVAGDTGASPGVCRHIFTRDNYSEDSIYWSGSAWYSQNQYDCHVAGEDINFLYNEATGLGYGVYHHGYSGQIVGNNFHDLGLYGVGIGTHEFWTDEVGVSKYQSDVLIEGNTISNPGAYGILLGQDALWGEIRYTSNVIISYNTITNVGTYGIRAYNTSYCLINNNDLTGDGTGTGIHLDATCHDVQGSENNFTNFTNDIVDNGVDNFDADGGYATIFKQDYSEIGGVPNTVHEYDYGGAATIVITDGGDFINVTNTAANHHVGQFYGFRNQTRCRYVIDVEWTTSGSYLYIGGLYLNVYGTAPNCKIRGKYVDTDGNPQYLPTVPGWWLTGANNRATITIDLNIYAWNEDHTKGYAYVYAVAGGTTYGPICLPLDALTTREDWFRNMFSPSIFNINPTNTAVVKIYSIEQKICTPRYVIGIGSNKHQPYGYDGPHPYKRTIAPFDPICGDGMNDVLSADMGGTIWADNTYPRNPIVNDPNPGDDYLDFLQYLISEDTGWDLGIHFSSTVEANLVPQFNTITTEFGYPPKTWCWIGAAPTRTAAEYIFKHCRGAVNRHFLTPTITKNFCSDNVAPPVISTVELFRNAATADYAGEHPYVHQTDVTPNIAYSLDSVDFDPWIADIIADGMKLIGYYGWYMMMSNQLDALFAHSTFEGDTTIDTATNGYGTMLLVKRDADLITVDDDPIDFLKTEDSFVIFELGDGESAVLDGGGGEPPPLTGGIGSRTIFGVHVVLGEPLLRAR